MAALSVIVLLGLGPIFSATNLVRQCFAVSIAVFFCVRFYHKKLFSTVASSFLGGLFHYSAPIVLILNFVPKKIISFRWWLLIVVLCFGLSGLIFENIFSFLSKNASIFGGFSIYFIDESTLSSSTGLGIRVIFEVFLFLFLSAHVSKIDPKGIWFFNITFFGVLLAYIFRDYGIFLRAASYLTDFKFLAIPWFLAAFNGLNKSIFFLLIVIYSSLSFARSAMSDQFSPYANFLFAIAS
jgi:hypothetical protein